MNGMNDEKLRALAHHMAAAAAYYAQRTGVMRGEGLAAHLHEAATQFFCARLRPAEEVTK